MGSKCYVEEQKGVNCLKKLTREGLNIFLIIFIFIVIFITLISQIFWLNGMQQDIVKGMSENADLQNEIREENQAARKDIEDLKTQIESIVREQKALRQNYDITGRGEKQIDKRVMAITAYDLSFESCGKYPGHPEYGITASGEKVKEWYTVAAGKSIPFGTRIYIPYFKDKPNKGIFTVEDRGGGVGDNQIDVYMKNYQDCMNFGRQKLEVWIIE